LSRFPNPGYPIAPRLLRPILSIGLPLAFARLGDKFPLLADLDETAWAYVDQSVADILGDLVIIRARQVPFAKFWRRTYFPTLTQGLQLCDIQIEQPTHECLSNAFERELSEGLPSLAQYTLDHVLSKTGIRPFIDLLTAVHFYIVDNSMAGDVGDRLELAQLRRIIRTPSTWRAYSCCYFPFLPKTARLEDLQLSVRGHNCMRGLLEEGVISDLADLSRLTLGQIMGCSNFGLMSLIELLKEIQPLILESASLHASASLAGVAPSVQGSAPLVDGASAKKLSNEDLHQIDLLTPVHVPTVASCAGDRLDRADLQRIIRRPSLWRTYSRKYFPFLPKTVRPEELRFSVRSQTCIDGLLKECVISDFADLSRLTLAHIMERSNFGLKSLIELLKEIQPLVLESAPVQASALLAGVAPAVQASAPLVGVASANQLSGEDVQQIITQSRPLELFLEKRIPDIPPPTELADMRLDVRTYNCITDLIVGNVISRPHDLSQLTVRRIMRTKNFGRKSLRNLLRSIEQLQLPQPVTTAELIHAAPKLHCPDLTRAAEKLVQSRVANRIRCNDPRISKLCGDLLYAVNNSGAYPPLDSKAGLQQVALRLAACTWTAYNVSQLLNQIRVLRLKLAELMRMELEIELRSLAATHIGTRDLEIVLVLWGWTGELPKTLQSVGDKFGLTRERIRQIVNKFEKVYRRRTAYLPSLERVLRFIARRVPTVAEDIEDELQSRRLTHSRFRVESIVECAKRFGQPVPFVIDESGGARVITEARGTGLTRLIAIRARRAVSKYGLANTVDLKEELTDTIHSGIDLKFFSNVIRAMESWEDLGKGWFWLRDLPRNHLLTIVRKVLAVAPRIHVSEMRAAIANDPRGMGFAPPKQVVITFCQNAAGCEIEDEVVIVRQRLDPLQVLSDTEQVILDVFRAHGPLLSRTALEEHCFKHGVKRSTLSLYAGRLAIIARYAPGVYGLRGAAFSPDDLDRASLRRQARYSDHGWTEKAQPWAAIELPASSLSNGIVQLPLSFRQTMSGRYALRTEDGQIIGHLVVSDRATWGLSPLFRRRGGEPGDILLLTFDLRRQEVTARLGDLTVIPEPARLAEEVID
jgi:DNA-directed RNA polymerase alpha subunit